MSDFAKSFLFGFVLGVFLFVFAQLGRAGTVNDVYTTDQLPEEQCVELSWWAWQAYNYRYNHGWPLGAEIDWLVKHIDDSGQSLNDYIMAAVYGYYFPHTAPGINASEAVGDAYYAVCYGRWLDVLETTRFGGVFDVN